MNVQAKTPVGQAVKLAPLNIGVMEITVVGDSPLIVHKFSEKAKEQMLDKQMKKASPGKEAKDPWRDFVESMYWLDGMPAKPTEKDVEAGRFGFPAVAFKAAAVTACTSIGDMTKVAARQAFHVESEFVEIISAAPSMREDVCRVGMGTADLRYRGEFMPWSAKLTVKFNANLMSAEQIINLFETAGFAVGIGEWRPERDGQFGRFHVSRGE
jgi:hypothetical protein